MSLPRYQSLPAPLPSYEYFPGVEIVQLERGLDPQEFAEFVGSLVVPAHFNLQGVLLEESAADPLGGVREMIRSSDTPSDPTRDQGWHADLDYWDEGQNPFATILYARRLVGRLVASTEFIDTSSLLQFAEENGYEGITEILRGGTTVFSGAKYYTADVANRPDKDEIQRIVSGKECITLDELIVKELKAHRPKGFPTISRHPFRKEGYLDCIMIDQPHTIDIVGTAQTKLQVQRFIADFIRDFLALPPEALEGRPYYVRHTWEEGQAAIWTQRGTLHRAGVSPPEEKTRDMLRQLMVQAA